MFHKSKKKYGDVYFKESMAILHLAAAQPGSEELKKAMAEMHAKYPDMGWGEKAASIQIRPMPVKAPKSPTVEPIKKPTQAYDPRSNDRTLNDGWVDGWPPDYDEDERAAIMFFA